MTEMDFRKAYAAEVKASAESKARCNEALEWAEAQRKSAIASHEGQLRNTIAFKTERDLLAKALEEIAELGDIRADEAGMIARHALDAVGGSGDRGSSDLSKSTTD